MAARTAGLGVSRGSSNLLGARAAPFTPFSGLRRVPLAHGSTGATLRCGPLRAGRGSKLQVGGGRWQCCAAAGVRDRQLQKRPQLYCHVPLRLGFGGACGRVAACMHAIGRCSTTCRRRRLPAAACRRHYSTPSPPTRAGGEQALGGPGGTGPVQPGE